MTELDLQRQAIPGSLQIVGTASLTEVTPPLLTPRTSPFRSPRLRDRSSDRDSLLALCIQNVKPRGHGDKILFV